FTEILSDVKLNDVSLNIHHLVTDCFLFVIPEHLLAMYRCLVCMLYSFYFQCFTKCCRVNGKPSPMRVKTKPVDGVRWYYITDTCKRDTLYELIAYHQKHPV